MKAVQVREFGLEHVTVAEVADPSPGQGEVLIATEAATINPADFAVVTGGSAGRLPWGSAPPYTPGWDLVGRVVAAGEGVGAAVIGSRVLGFSLWFESLRGTQAALVALPVGNVVPAPDGLPAAQLTTVGLNGLTAWRGLADLKLATGETLVVTGAAGSVGGFAVELAAARGFTVIGVVRDDQKQDALDLGATAVVSSGDADLGAAVRAIVPGGADALLDTASVAGPALAAIRDGGKYVTVTALPAAERGIDVFRAGGRMDDEALRTLADMASTGRLRTPVARAYSVDDARAAYEAFAGRAGRGRHVLTFPGT
ncbi:MAG TPA: NADP-dependent oxidoreductase [Trebonia sp.]|nr:NADP-dependent oxidoreductase [Trebonia sp.]